MRKISDWENVEEAGSSEFKQLPAGGYVAYITKVEDVPDRKYLKFEYDILGGEYADYASKFVERHGFNPLTFIRPYSDKAVGFFKGFISLIEKENHGFVWDWNEQNLLKRHIGVVLGEAEYRKRDGSIGTRLEVTKIVPCNDILMQKFTVPEKKRLPVEDAPPAWVGAAQNADELPLDL